MYGAHIFHTNDKRVWNYITQFAEFNRFTNSPVANYKGELYSMPFNMYTFNKMWGVVTPEEAAAKIEEQKKQITGEPKNLEEQAISLVGRDIYEKLVKATLRNSGAVIVRSFRLSSSSDFLLDLPLTTITSTLFIRVFQSVATPRWLKICSTALRSD